MFIEFIIDPSEIGSLCEELVSDYDSSIVKMLQRVADGSSQTVEEELCVKVAHICSKKEYRRVRINLRYDGVDTEL